MTTVVVVVVVVVESYYSTATKCGLFRGVAGRASGGGER
jgi:hypothetical protein